MSPLKVALSGQTKVIAKVTIGVFSDASRLNTLGKCEGTRHSACWHTTHTTARSAPRGDSPSRTPHEVQTHQRQANMHGWRHECWSDNCLTLATHTTLFNKLSTRQYQKCRTTVSRVNIRSPQTVYKCTGRTTNYYLSNETCIHIKPAIKTDWKSTKCYLISHNHTRPVIIRVEP